MASFSIQRFEQKKLIAVDRDLSSNVRKPPTGKVGQPDVTEGPVPVSGLPVMRPQLRNLADLP
jgi:hypothetical protein